MHFDKKPLSIDEHIKLLQDRGMLIENLDIARHSLSHINYYRLSGYWLPFEEDRTSIIHKFKAGTKFEEVLNLYNFDRKLRLQVLKAVEYIEGSLRRQWAYFMADHHGSHSYLNEYLAKNLEHFKENLDRLKQETKRSKEIFIKHYRDKYSSPELPPIWSVCEVMSLGLLSRWFRNLKNNKTRKAIAKIYRLNHKFLENFIYHLTIVRNICAHHGRLWNRKLTVTITSPRNLEELSSNFNLSQKHRLYNTLVVSIWMLNIINPNNFWSKQVLDLIDLHKIDVAKMGFPENYRNYPIWNL
ncbi:MAG: Abi family protein [Cyanobacteria bacterium SBLK]|nr:Abi family protein [Cyanobacteria bacterium SBLK]